MKKILIAIMLLASIKAQAQLASYSLTPTSIGTVNVAIAITTPTAHGAKTVDYPVNSIYPSFSQDSVTVIWYNIYDLSSPIFHADSINHFWTGSYNFFYKDVKGLDSFFHAKMIR